LPEALDVQEIFQYPQAQAVGFVRQEPVTPVGRIFRSDGNITLLSQGDRIYVETTDGSVFTEGDRFTVYRNEGKLENPYGGSREKVLGYQHRIMGTAYCEMVQPGMMVAIVESSFDGIRLGDLFMPYREVPGEYAVINSASKLSGRIVASEDRCFLFAQDDVVFLDLGARKGVTPGQVFEVVHREPGLVEGSWLPSVKIGKLLVLWTEDNNSTAVIIESDGSMSPGASIQSRLLDMP
ncbi:MAG: hypothetical protein ABIJ95_12335, partial [Pseudomonadota bacterium]